MLLPTWTMLKMESDAQYWVLLALEAEEGMECIVVVV